MSLSNKYMSILIEYDKTMSTNCIKFLIKKKEKRDKEVGCSKYDKATRPIEVGL